MSSPQSTVVPSAPADPPAPEGAGAKRGRDDDSHARNFRPGFLAKLCLLAVVNAFGFFVLWSAGSTQAWGIFTSMVVLLAAANWVYFAKRPLPLKYILPGLAFLLVYQVFVVGYTGYIAFTNYGDGHNSSKAHAVDALLAQNEHRVENSPSYPLTVVDRDGELGFAILEEDGEVLVGTAEDPFSVAGDAVVEDGRVTEVPGWTVLNRPAILDRQNEITTLRVPYTDDPEDGSIRTQDGRQGFVFESILEFDEDADTMTNTETGVVYRPNDRGQFEAEDGSRLNVGWRVAVGFENFETAFSDTRYAGPLLRVMAWTFAFAALSVVTTFLLGLFLANVFNETRLRGRKIYRTLLILPYAFPAFLGALLWSGMLNRTFGFINQTLLNGAAIPWLTDPWLAKVSVIGVNLWMGFPYMFLICTGALQSLPADALEAAKIDGAGKLRTFRSITMPLLLVSTAPLLISSFAFNFNNFTLIYMLTGGGPRFADASVPIGHTDILISMVYSISGLDGSGTRNFGLASALSIVIFLIVATISAISFRRTRALEEIH